MKINLIRVPDPSCIDDYMDCPLGLLYLSSSLKQHGYDVIVNDLAGTGYNWKNYLDLNADLFGITLYTPTANIGIDIAKYIKEIKGNKTPVICGGPHPTAVPFDKNLNIFDCIFQSECENVLPMALDVYNKTNVFPKSFIGGNNSSLDDIPFPDRNAVDIMKYHRKVDGEKCFGIISSRGCPFSCNFCDKSMYFNSKKIRFRSIDNIVKELKECIDKYNVNHFEFFDDLFAVNKDRLTEFHYKTKDLNLNYRCNSRSDTLTPEIALLLKKSGCSVICFGIESGNQKILDLMNKKTTVEQNYKGIKIAKNSNIFTTGYFIIGFPGETVESINDTMEFIKKSELDKVSVYQFSPLPGTDVYNNPEKYGVKIIAKDWSDYYMVTGKDGHGGKSIETKWLSADELEIQMKKIRKYLKEKKFIGNLQDYEKKLFNLEK